MPTPESPEPTFKVGDRVRFDFERGYIVTQVTAANVTYPDDPGHRRILYDLALPHVHDDELLCWADELTMEPESKTIGSTLDGATAPPAEGVEVSSPGQLAALWNGMDDAHRAEFVKGMQDVTKLAMRCTMQGHDEKMRELDTVWALHENATKRNTKLRIALQNLLEAEPDSRAGWEARNAARGALK